jgi:hypothetical protein
MKVSRIVIFAGLFFAAAVSLSFGRSILEKKMFYFSAANKSGEAKFWTVYLGNHDCTLTRKFPGEDPQPVSGSVNLSLLSSGYIEGNGYSARGHLDCLPTIKIKSDKGERTIGLDSIDCIYNYGAKVRTLDGETGDFIIDVEGVSKTANRFILTEYKLVDSYGEKVLKPGSGEMPLAAISFSKQGIQWAQKAGSEEAAKSAAPATPAPAPAAQDKQ